MNKLTISIVLAAVIIMSAVIASGGEVLHDVMLAVMNGESVSGAGVFLLFAVIVFFGTRFLATNGAEG